ncbi:unnamed protein product [Acanthoscelides obtectus]|uniref:Uncharacterized protein n=1 Tax=Acanthoscelides obtectus TaxID=200917 RepID=A0A9P0M540_ACAOB|nr:unnamed protein product [Acanthoscelides obtectus]CAK1629429.1 hypothetical protein AOBTE_LOCUS5739 [Acanthoscelides obtectus]
MQMIMRKTGSKRRREARTKSTLSVSRSCTSFECKSPPKFTISKRTIEECPRPSKGRARKRRRKS